jgi:hypothetical protein
MVLGSMAQTIPYTLTQAEPAREKLTQRFFGVEPLGVVDGHVYYLYQPYMAVYGDYSQGNIGNYQIAKYDADLKLLKKEVISLENENRKRSLHSVFQLKGSFYLFSAFQNDKHQKHYLFVQTIDKESLATDANMKMIGEIDFSDINKYYSTYFHHEVSPDSSKVLVYYNVVNKKNENLRYGMYVYTSAMELVWKAENVSPDITEGVFSYQKFRVDNQGNVYLQGTNYTNLKNYYASSNFKDRGFFSSDTYHADFPNYTTQLYLFTDKGKTRKTVNLDLPGKFIRSLTFLPVKNGKVFCAGIYSAPETISAKGTFAFDLDMQTKKMSNLSIREFDQSLIELGFDENEMKRFKRSIDNKEEWDPFNYLLSDIKINSRGEKYFVAEQFIQGTKTERQGNTIVYKTIFLHNDLYVTRLNSKQQISQIDKISKRQYAITTNQFNSYALFEVGDKLYFTYMEIVKKNTMFKNAEPGDTWLIELNRDGTVNREVLNPAGSKHQLFPMTQTGNPFGRSSLIYTTVSLNFKDHALEKISINP